EDHRAAPPRDEAGQRHRAAGRAVALPQLEALERSWSRSDEVEGVAGHNERLWTGMVGRAGIGVAHRLRPLRRAVALPEDGALLGIVRHEVEAVLEDRHLAGIRALAPRPQIGHLVGAARGTVAAPELRTVDAVVEGEEEQAERRDPPALAEGREL